MSDVQPLRPHEVATDAPLAQDAALAFIGRVRTPWPRRADCPRQGDPEAGPECRIEVFPPWDAALDGIERFERIEALYWLHHSRRDLIRQNPGQGAAHGTFSLRSPIRPNPIGTALLRLVRREGPVLIVRGLDCVDGTPLIDLKPDRCAYTPPGGAG